MNADVNMGLGAVLKTAIRHFYVIGVLSNVTLPKLRVFLFYVMGEKKANYESKVGKVVVEGLLLTDALFQRKCCLTKTFPRSLQ